jgi:hypothetical protein
LPLAIREGGRAAEKSHEFSVPLSGRTKHPWRGSRAGRTMHFWVLILRAMITCRFRMGCGLGVVSRHECPPAKVPLLRRLCCDIRSATSALTHLPILWSDIVRAGAPCYVPCRANTTQLLRRNAALRGSRSRLRSSSLRMALDRSIHRVG